MKHVPRGTCVLFLIDVPRGTFAAALLISERKKLCVFLQAQNYLFSADVPRGTLNNDNNATKAHAPSNTTNG
jgi:hypothetical protein